MSGGLQDFFPPCEVSKVFKYSFAIIQWLRLIFDVEQQDLSDCGPAAAGNDGCWYTMIICTMSC